MLALDGVKVLDFCRNAPGMFCTMALGDLGADVLMIERPMAGDRAEYEQSVAGISNRDEEERRAVYNALQRNKRSIALNLKEQEAQGIFHELAKTADVLVEGFRPGVMDRLGAGYDTVKRINPRAVYCSISGYGQDGPYAQLAGHDINYLAMSGALDLIGYSQDDKPAIPMNLLADFAGGGLCGAVGILAALMARHTTGQGQYVDIAMTEGVLYMLAGTLSGFFARGVAPGRGTTRLNGGAPYYNVYNTKDGKYFTIAAIEPWFWRNLCTALGREDLAGLQSAEGQEKEQVEQFLTETFLTRTRDEWFESLRDENISVGKVYSIDEVVNDPQVAYRNMVIEVPAPNLPGKSVKQVGIPMRLSDTPGKVRHVGAATGSHTFEVLASLGYSPELIEELRRRAVVQ